MFSVYTADQEVSHINKTEILLILKGTPYLHTGKSF